MSVQPRAAPVPTPLREEAEALLARYVEAGGAAPQQERVLAAFAKSPFLAAQALRDPATFDAMLADPAATAARGADEYRAAVASLLAGSEDMAEAQAALRRWRRAEFARIAWRDLVLGASLAEIMAELSAAADAVIANAVAWLHGQFAARYGRALAADGSPLELLVLAMGKLGGEELNFSSDIDLIFVYDEPGTTSGGRKAVSHQDYFDRLGRDLIMLLNETTADGFVFRVDMRLRPFGDSGPLTASLSALEQYYTVHGRDWERYALIKARAVSGGPRLRTALAALIRPFVYRRYLDYGALDALREMKALINREASSRQLEHDIKRGTGGIREIEFTAQLFQLTRGGREARLRERALLGTLAAAADLGLLEPAEAAGLAAAYRFLRTTEHRLQQVNDEQTHTLPSTPREQARLAFAMGAPDWPAFQAELAIHREFTSRLFAALLAPPEATAQAAAGGPWRELWSGPAAREHALATLTAAGIAADPAMLDMLLDLKSPRFVSRLSRQGRERLDRLLPLLLETMHAQALAPAACARLGALLHAIARRSVYLAFLADHPPALTRLLELFNASAWIADQITRYPILLDELLDPRTLFAPPDAARLRQLAADSVAQTDDLETAMEALRGFKNQQVLRVAASDVTGQFPVAEVSNQLTYIAEACLAAALTIAWRELEQRYGAPHCADEGGLRPVRFAIVGYGKLGGWELGYGSDLDLVFVHDGSGTRQVTVGARSIENNVFFTRLAQRLIHILATNTASGAAYEVDTRLRPSGTAGQLVPGIDAFEHYLRDEAWVWEHQALVRARAVAGDEVLGARFARLREAVLARPREPAVLAAEITQMRSRMLAERDRGAAQRFDLKHGRGGITDIEFMVQYAVLRWACAHPRLLVWSDNLRLLEIIAELGLWPATTCASLHEAWFAYRAEIHRLTLQQADCVVAAERFRAHRAQVLARWDEVFAQ